MTDAYENRTEYAVESVDTAVVPPPAGSAPGQEQELAGRRSAAAPMAPAPPVAQSVVRSTFSSSTGTAANRPRQILWLAYAIVAAFLVIDVIFHAAGASTASPFVDFIYKVGGALNAPFRNIFSGERPGVATIEWADVIALAVYAVAAWIVERVIIIMRSRQQPSAMR